MFNINFQTVADSKEIPALIRLLAKNLIDGTSYFTIGNWLSTVSSYDLVLLQQMIDNVRDDDKCEETLQLILLTEMLCAAEGVDHDELKTSGRLDLLVTYIMCEALYRKDVIEFDRSLCSFEHDTVKSSMAWPKGKPRPVDK